MVHFFVMGMICVRSSSLGAFSDTANFGRTVSAPKSAMRGTMPEVETVMRDSGMPTAFDQQTHGLHEVVVVQERLALSHEDQIDTVAFHLDLLVVEHGENLPDDFSGAQITLQSQQGGHAEGALHRASHLAGDADGGALWAILRSRDGSVEDPADYRDPSTRRRNNGVGSLRMTSGNI